MNQALKDQIIEEALARNDLHGRVIAKFIASDIPDLYQKFFEEEHSRLNGNKDKALELLTAHSVCLAGIVFAIAMGNREIAKALAEAIQIAVGEKKLGQP